MPKPNAACSGDHVKKNHMSVKEEEREGKRGEE
jgi:hypothetical protein